MRPLAAPNFAHATPPLASTPHTGLADTGATGHYMAMTDIDCLTNLRPTPAPVTVTLPDGSTATSTHTGLLNLPHLPLAARTCHLFPAFRGSLISIGQLTDHGLVATFDATSTTISTPSGQPVMRGYRSPSMPLWRFRLVPTSPADEHVAANVAPTGTIKDTIAFLHACMGSPATSTLREAVRCAYTRLPGLTVSALHRHPPNSVATAKGHLDRNRQGQRSTHPAPVSDTFPRTCSLPTKHVYTQHWEVNHRQYIDITGRFPVPSVNGAEYLLLFYAEDPNFIHLEALPNRSAAAVAQAYRAGHQWFAHLRVTTTYLQMDNEASPELRAFCEHACINLQFCPPNNHRANKAERCIRTIKNHIIALLAATDPDFPLDAWELLLPIAELTANMLRGSNINPLVSAWDQLHGAYDFSAHPLAPPGIKVLAFEDPDTRDSWAPHGRLGYYLGPALEHYRCHRIYLPETKRVRVLDTLSWHPTTLVLPGCSPLDALSAASRDLAHALRRCAASPHLLTHQRQPLADTTTSLTSALNQLQDIFLPEPPPSVDHHVPPPPLLPADECAISPPIQRVETVVEPPFQRVDTVVDPPLQRVDPVPNGTMAPDEFEVDQVVGHRRSRGPRNGITEYRVRWKGYPPDQDTWEEGAESFQLAINDYLHSTQAPTSPATYMDYSAFRPRSQRHRPALAHACLTGNANSTMVANAVLDAYLPLCDLAIGHPAAALSSVDLDNNGRPLTYNLAVTGPDKLLWEQAHSEEWLRLIESTACIEFVPFTAKPTSKRATYYNPQVKIKLRPSGPERRVRGTAGGDRVSYDGDVSADTASLPTIKLLWNATCSEHAMWMTIDIKDFYLGTPMDHPEFMRVALKHIPHHIQLRYHLKDLAREGVVLVRINKGIYGLPQAGILARRRLVSHLGTHGYYSCPSTPSLFRHTERDIAFTLVVDDFGVKYQSADDPQHLIAALQELYTVTIDWEGRKYVGITTLLDPTSHTMTLSMPGYVANALKRFGLDDPKPTHSGRLFTPPRYGSRATQLAPQPDTSAPLSPSEAKEIQQFVGVFLFYARAVDATMLFPISKLSSLQAHPTQAIRADVDRFLHYAATYPNAHTVIHPSAMVLRVDSDASYLSESQSRSRGAGYLYMGTDKEATPINAAVDIVCTILPTVTSSAAESEYVALFINGQKGEPLRNTLHDLGYPQGATPLKTDNECATGIATDTIQQRRSKAIMMRFHWVRERVRLGHFHVYWRPGCENLADYFTKTHPVHHIRTMRPSLVSDHYDPADLAHRWAHHLPLHPLMLHELPPLSRS